MSHDAQEPLLGSFREVGDGKGASWVAFKQELKAILILCGPACIQLGFQQAILVPDTVKWLEIAQDAETALDECTVP